MKSEFVEEINETRKDALLWGQKRKNSLSNMPGLGIAATETREHDFKFVANTPGIAKDMNKTREIDIEWGKKSRLVKSPVRLGAEEDIDRTKDSLNKLMHSKTKILEK